MQLLQQYPVSAVQSALPYPPHSFHSPKARISPSQVFCRFPHLPRQKCKNHSGVLLQQIRSPDKAGPFHPRYLPGTAGRLFLLMNWNVLMLTHYKIQYA